MSRSTDIYAFRGHRMYVGLSAVIGVTVTPGQLATTIKHGGGGTLWAGGPNVDGASLGYLVYTGEAINVDSSGTIYFVSAGATSTLYILRGKSMGFEP